MVSLACWQAWLVQCTIVMPKGMASPGMKVFELHRNFRTVRLIAGVPHCWCPESVVSRGIDSPACKCGLPGTHEGVRAFVVVDCSVLGSEVKPLEDLCLGTVACAHARLCWV